MITTTVQSIDTGDTVRHTPSGENWLVAYVTGGMLCACGWPCTLVPVTECTLTEKATAEKRLDLLQQLASGQADDPRRSHALRALTTAQPNAASGAEVASTAPVLPIWWQWFIQNICELPDRNSPEDEPEAMVATPDELENCAIRAMERLAAPGDGQGALSVVPRGLYGPESGRPGEPYGNADWIVQNHAAVMQFLERSVTAPGAAIAARGQIGANVAQQLHDAALRVKRTTDARKQPDAHALAASVMALVAPALSSGEAPASEGGA